MSIVDQLHRIRERIARAAAAAGRPADAVRLVGVTKYVGHAEAAELVDAGCRDLGESRPQQLWTKAAELAAHSDAGRNVQWHLVGHLQRNKVRRTLPLVAMIHSVDSQRLLAAIERVAAPLVSAGQLPRPAVPVLLEVNTSGESAKHGLPPDEVAPLLAAADRFPHVAICGLMTMAARGGGSAEAARNFAALRALRDRLQPALPPGVSLEELSMGMSGDFEAAIREGATLVRIGSALWQ